MRWIQNEQGRTKRGEVDPPLSGNLFFVDEVGSKALVGDVLYVDGKLAPTGLHEITFRNGDVLPFDVGQSGRATRRPLLKGGNANDNRSPRGPR